MRQLVLALAVVAPFAAGGAAQSEPLVFAAASTGRALDEVIAASGLEATVAYGSSGTLARQIVAGAPVDLFLSANPEWMRHLVDEGLVALGSERTLLSNRLVLIVPAASQTRSLETALEALGSGEQFAMADPETAPVGRYGRDALTTLGLWADIAPRHVPTRNTIVTVAMVGRGEAVLGLVYASDAQGVDAVAVAHEIPTDAHPPITYPVARLEAGTDAAGADQLLNHLLSPDAQAIFAEHGFSVVDAGP